MAVAARALERIAAVVGPAGVVVPDDAAGMLVDERRLYRGAALGVVRPASTAEVAAVIRICREARLAVVPQGGNTGYCGGATPFDSQREILLSLSRLNRIREVDELGFTLTAEAGVVLASAQAAASERGLLFPLSMGSEGSAQIGGALSTNAGGLAVLRYGTARELVLGLEVVLPSGEVLADLGGLRKDNTGYDLKALFLGAEGTLGVITAAVLKLFPEPRARETAWLAVSSVTAACHARERRRGSRCRALRPRADCSAVRGAKAAIESSRPNTCRGRRSSSCCARSRARGIRSRPHTRTISCSSSRPRTRPPRCAPWPSGSSPRASRRARSSTVRSPSPAHSAPTSGACASACPRPSAAREVR